MNSMPDTEGGDKNWTTTCTRLEACLKAIYGSYEQWKTLCASEEPLKFSESDLSKLVLPGIGILRGIVVTFTFMIPNFFLNQYFKR